MSCLEMTSEYPDRLNLRALFTALRMAHANPLFEPKVACPNFNGFEPSSLPVARHLPSLPPCIPSFFPPSDRQFPQPHLQTGRHDGVERPEPPPDALLRPMGPMIRHMGGRRVSSEKDKKSNSKGESGMTLGVSPSRRREVEPHSM